MFGQLRGLGVVGDVQLPVHAEVELVVLPVSPPVSETVTEFDPDVSDCEPDARAGMV
jgi:hypothetical protein